MRSSRRPTRATVMALLVLLPAAHACGSDRTATTTATTTTTAPGRSSYCADLRQVMRVLDGGGSEAEYHARLAGIVEESPPDHAPTWLRMLTLSEEPFRYDNFNAAVDSLDRISADLDARCPGLDRMIVDDRGRMREQPVG